MIKKILILMGTIIALPKKVGIMVMMMMMMMMMMGTNEHGDHVDDHLDNGNDGNDDDDDTNEHGDDVDDHLDDGNDGDDHNDDDTMSMNSDDENDDHSVDDNVNDEDHDGGVYPDDNDDGKTEDDVGGTTEEIPQPLTAAVLKKKLSLLPLYSDAPLSTKASWIACNYFSVTNNLSEAATKQLQDLIAIHCPKRDQCARSTYQLRKRLNLFDDVEMHMYCSECMKELKDTKKCIDRNCRRKRSKVCYLSLLPFHQHLSTIFSNKWNDILKHFSRKRTKGIIQDIDDGTICESLRAEGAFLSCPEHAGLILCTDGVPVFKSSGQTLWPVLMFTTSLPPEVRMNVENMIVAALWLGPCKPSIDVLLPSVLSKIDLLHTNGIEFSTPHGKKVLRVKIVAAVFDFPAKAMALNIVQFNGYYGCPYCKDRGIHKCHRHLYLPAEPHIAKDPGDIDAWARKAEEILKPVFGVKGFSMLMKA
ncbi:hypothetical protein EMCRGX_G007386 [Ephydatia muelleri]